MEVKITENNNLIYVNGSNSFLDRIKEYFGKASFNGEVKYLNVISYEITAINTPRLILIDANMPEHKIDKLKEFCQPRGIKVGVVGEEISKETKQMVKEVK